MLLAGRAAKREPHLVGIVLVEEAFVPQGPLILGIDETLERRWGKKIAAKGIYRDPIRSTHETFVKSSGLRWVHDDVGGDPLGFSSLGFALLKRPGSF